MFDEIWFIGESFWDHPLDYFVVIVDHLKSFLIIAAWLWDHRLMIWGSFGDIC